MAYDLYVVTDEQIGRGRTHAEQALSAVAGGADAIQLRDKSLPGRELFAIACEIRKITRPAGALFIVNDRLDVALAAGADGVHLGQSDLPLEYARRIAPPGFIIGVSVGCTREAAQAEAAGADYVALSPTFPTASKADAGPGHGLAALAAIRPVVSVPVIAIGGIGHHNLREVIAAGADGVAVISAVVGQADMTAAARQMKSLITAAKETAGRGSCRRA